MNICPSLQTNIYTSRPLSVWGFIPVFSVGAYLVVDHCVLLECTVTHENNYSLTNLAQRTASRSKDTSVTLNVQRSAINHPPWVRTYYLRATVSLLKEKKKRVVRNWSNGLLTVWRRSYFFLILAHPVYKMWIKQEPNKLELRNKRHFEEKGTESIYHV